MKHRALLRRRQFAEWRIERKSHVLSNRLREARERILRRQFRPRRQRAFAQRAVEIADQQRWIGSLLHTQAFASRTPTQRAVEREVVRIKWLEAAAAAVAGKVLAEAFDRPVGFGLL